MLGQLLVNSLTLGSIYALTALGFSVIYRATGVVNFAQGELMMLGAMIALFLLRDLHFGYSLAFLLSVLACMLIGFAIERIAFRPLSDAPHFTVLLSTIAVAQIIRSGVRAFFGQELSLFPPAFSTVPFTVIGVRVTMLNLGVLAVAAVTLVAFAIFFARTRVGWAMRATAQNSRGATIVGVDVPNVYSVTWAIAGGLAAISGVLLAPLIVITPDMGVIGNICRGHHRRLLEPAGSGRRGASPRRHRESCRSLHLKRLQGCHRLHAPCPDAGGVSGRPVGPQIAEPCLA